MFWASLLLLWGGLMLLLQQMSTISKPPENQRLSEVRKPLISEKAPYKMPHTEKRRLPTAPETELTEKPEEEADAGREPPYSTDAEIPEANEEHKVSHAIADRQIQKPRGTVSIIIDDMGRDIESAKKFLALPYPLAFAVLPYEAHSKEVAEMIRKSGRTLLLHMPMEPRGYPEVNPGPGALLLSQSEEEQYRLFKKALKQVPGALGVNNHMGSRFTEDREAMRRFMRWLKEEGLFFVDSRTTAKTVACEAAREVGVPCLERNVFIDHELTRKFIVSQLAELARRASTQGYALAIGHPHEITYRVLRDNLSRYSVNGLQLVSLRKPGE